MKSASAYASAATSTSTLSLRVLVPYLGHTLTEVDLDPSVIHEGIVHLEIRLVALLLGTKFHKGIAQRIARLGITDNLRPCIGIESRKYQLQILIVCDGIKLAYK